MRNAGAAIPAGPVRSVRFGGRAAGSARRRHRHHPTGAGAVRRRDGSHAESARRNQLARPPARRRHAAPARGPGHRDHPRHPRRHDALAVGGLPTRPAHAARCPPTGRPAPDVVRAVAARRPGPDRRHRAPSRRRTVRRLARPATTTPVRRPQPGHRETDPAGPRRDPPRDRVPDLATRPGPHAGRMPAGRYRRLVRRRLHRAQAHPHLPALGDWRQTGSPTTHSASGHPPPVPRSASGSAWTSSAAWSPTTPSSCPPVSRHC